MFADGRSALEKIYQFFATRPWVLASAIVLALVLLPVAVWLDLRNLSDVALERQATGLNAMITDIRSYYARNIVNRVQAHPGDTIAVDDYDLVPGAVPIPATLSLELGEVIGRRSRNFRYRFVSDFPFKGRDSHNLDAFERNALSAFRAQPKEQADSGPADRLIMEIDGSLFDRHVRLAAPVVMGEACVACHNTHPDSPKTDWSAGDIRGIQAIEVEQPIAADLGSFRFLLTYFVLAGIFGAAFAAMQARQARTVQRMNSELEESNSFLATVSLKISKYLSPQVYRSIFSGERDATLTTERKKLTIFFSDIKDFTVTSERLQPEELTELLNEYFTEMSAIAEQYGATVDKFIGDAILVFFGDPETKGAREDARACVQMAVAMQRRMGELRQRWRRRGIEQPFHTRMGINTGYCNVGNFGSNDRMDYTIIGAEANLAARLEEIAEPGGIVMSYENYVHAEDLVEAQKLPPISLKGISREIVPYSVTHVAEGQKQAPIVDAESEGARVFVDARLVPEDERERVRSALKKALVNLDDDDTATSR